MTLIPDWRHAWRFFSVAGAVILGAANVVLANSDALQVLLPQHTAAYLNAAAAIAIAAGRVIQQQIPARDAPPPPADPASAQKEPS